MNHTANSEGALPTLSQLVPKLFHSPAMKGLFQENASAEYLLMWLFSRHSEAAGGEKIYLKDMADELHLPINKVSAIARSLRDKGLVRWTHDGDGREGTYLQLTETAVTSAAEHRKALHGYHRRVVDAYGEEPFLQLLADIARLEEIMQQEAEKVEEPK